MLTWQRNTNTNINYIYIYIYIHTHTSSQVQWFINKLSNLIYVYNMMCSIPINFKKIGDFGQIF
jgi:hypothetical protein